MQKHGGVWRHLRGWRGHLLFLRGIVVVVVITDFNDCLHCLLHASPLDEELVVTLGVSASDDVLRFAARVRAFRIVIH